MTAFRSIAIKGFTAPDAIADPGARPELRWIAISDLCVSEKYQRPIIGGGQA